MGVKVNSPNVGDLITRLNIYYTTVCDNIHSIDEVIVLQKPSNCHFFRYAQHTSFE